MSSFRIDPDLESGTIFEVAGSSIKIALSRDNHGTYKKPQREGIRCWANWKYLKNSFG